MNKLGTPPWKKNDLVPNRLISYVWNELWAAKRNNDIKDESIWDFIARRFGADIADVIVDPVIKGFVCDFKTV
jgi:hypothetical protein